MEPNGRIRQSKIIRDTNSFSVVQRMQTFIEQRPLIDIEHITSFANEYMASVIITYFEPYPKTKE